jgi:hypothetical protein
LWPEHQLQHLLCNELIGRGRDFMADNKAEFGGKRARNRDAWFLST